MNNIICNPFFSTRKFPSTDNNLSCFVIMPFSGDMIQDVYKEYTKPTVEEVGIKCIRGDDIFSATSIMEDIFGSICQADIIIGEFTGRNPNVLYEAGIAHTLGKPLIGITQDINDVPFDLRSIRHIVYKTTPSGLKDLKNALQNTLKAVLEQKYEMFPQVFNDNGQENKALWEALLRERQKTDEMYSRIESRIINKYEQYRQKIRELSPSGYRNIEFYETGINFVKVNASSIDIDYFDDDDNEVKNIDSEMISEFHISKAPITNVQYAIFMKETGHPCPDYWENGVFQVGQGNCPVMGVSWVDIVMFCKWLTEVSGFNIDIPSEAQWLAAAGYGIDKQLYPWGNTWIENACNSKEFDRGRRRITPVERFEKNVSPYGCIDMLGNVWEWTKSPYNFRDSQGFEWRAVRGGANYTNLNGVGNLARLVAHPGHFLFVHDLGFRVVTTEQI